MNNFLREAASSYLNDAAILATLMRRGSETPAEASRTGAAVLKPRRWGPAAPGTLAV